MSKTVLIGVLFAAAATVLLAAVAGGKRRDERKRRFVATDRKGASAWQAESRKLLFELLALSDLVKADQPKRGKPGIALKPAVLSTKVEEKYTLYELELSSTPTRRFKAILTVPKGSGQRKRPSQTTFPRLRSCVPRLSKPPKRRQ